MSKRLVYIIFCLIFGLFSSGICQTSGDSTNNDGYFTIIFNSQSVTSTVTWSAPSQGDYYLFNFTNNSTSNAIDVTNPYVLGNNISRISKDSLVKTDIQGITGITITFLKSDQSCWLKTSDVETKLEGDTLLITNIRISPLMVTFDRKQACENDSLPIIPTLSENISEIEYTSPDGLNVDRYTGAVNLSNQSPGVYSIKYTSTYCLSKDIDTITIRPRPSITIEKNRKICEGRSIELSPDIAKNDSVFWSTGAISRSISVSTPGKYALTAENQFGCRQTDTIDVQMKTIKVEHINYEVSEADCYNPGRISFKNLDISNGISPFIYSFKNKITNQIIHDTTNLREGDYILTIEDGDGCITAYSSAISIRKDCLNDYPVFSPNTDGRDDEYYIPYEGEAIVYDRNGIERNRFMAPDYWDGKDKNGNLLPMGTYLIVGKKQVINITIIN